MSVELGRMPRDVIESNIRAGSVNEAAAQAGSIDPLSYEDAQTIKKFNEIGFTNIHPTLDEIKFLMKTKLVFWIDCFRNSTAHGSEKHEPKTIDGRACIKKEGQWVKLSDIMNEVEFCHETGKIVSKNNPYIVWSYLSPNGLVPFDRFSYQELPVIEELTQEEVEKIKQDAQSFWENEQEVDPGVQKKCVLQVITTNRAHSKDWKTENLVKAYPEHATFRLITEDGKVYSFGFQMEQEEEAEIFADSRFPFPLTFTKTSKTRITTPDYEEPRPFRQKRITSVPVTSERLGEIMRFVADENDGTLSFNFFRQNCATLGREVLKRAGVSTPERWTLGFGLSQLLPTLEKVPYVGKPLNYVVNIISAVAQEIFAFLDAITPAFIQEGVFFIPRKISTLLANAAVCLVGGRLTSLKEPLSDDVQDDLDNTKKFTRFSRLIRTISDIFRDDLSMVDAHLSLIEWQKKQKTTKHVDFTKVKLEF